jgi:hypothetical protein
MAVTDPTYRSSFETAMFYAEDAAYGLKEHFPVFLMGNSLQTYVRSKSKIRGAISDMGDLKHTNSRIQMVTHPEETFLFNDFSREKKHATFNTAQFFNNQRSGVTATGLMKEDAVRNKIKPVATYSSHGIDEVEEQFIAIAEGINMPLYAFTYAIDMTQFYFEDPSATLDNFELDHSLVARTHAQTVANIIADEARLCEHEFRLPEEIFERLIRHKTLASVSYTSTTVAKETMPVGMETHDIYILQ